MNTVEGFEGAVGNTPLIYLEGPSLATGCTILGKAEFLNPGGSVKDRAALHIINTAEREGRLKPGGTVIEGTAGNTGIGLAHICRARGYRCIIVIPETQSPEKIDLLRALGADVRTVKAAPYKSPDNFQKIAGRLAEVTENAIWANQFDNTANREAHYLTTGPEIWEQTEGEVDAFVCAVGTGGTLGGISRFLKEKNPNIITAVADPTGSALYNFVEHGIVEPLGPSSISEGIGTTRITENFKDSPVDFGFQINDQECVDKVYQLLNDGLFLGGSSGINVAGAERLARKLGKGHTIVTMLCDTGARYQSRLFNRNWLLGKGLHVDYANNELLNVAC